MVQFGLIVKKRVTNKEKHLINGLNKCRTMHKIKMEVNHQVTKQKRINLWKNIYYTITFIKIFITIYIGVEILILVTWWLIFRNNSLKDYLFSIGPFLFALTFAYFLVDSYKKHSKVIKKTNYEDATKLYEGIKNIFNNKHWKIQKSGENFIRYNSSTIDHLWGRFIMIELNNYTISVTGSKREVDMIINKFSLDLRD